MKGIEMKKLGFFVMMLFLTVCISAQTFIVTTGYAHESEKKNGNDFSSAGIMAPVGFYIKSAMFLDSGLGFAVDFNFGSPGKVDLDRAVSTETAGCCLDDRPLLVNMAAFVSYVPVRRTNIVLSFSAGLGYFMMASREYHPDIRMKGLEAVAQTDFSYFVTDSVCLSSGVKLSCALTGYDGNGEEDTVNMIPRIGIGFRF
jgi:hypothetical protein